MVEHLPSVTNVPAHGELFIGGVMDEKCRIILHINLPSSNGGLFAYQHTEMHRHAASSSRTNNGNMQLLSLFFLFFLSFFTQEVVHAALNGRLLFCKKEKGERRLFRLRLVKRYSLLRFMILLIILWLNEYRMHNRILPTMPRSDIAI